MLAVAQPVWFPILDESQTGREQIDGVLANRFTFNGETHQFEAGFDWTTNPSSDVEWLILLHKFYYAPGLGRAYSETGDECYPRKWVELTEAWMDSTPLDFLTSDVAGRRIQNWIFALHYFQDSPSVSTDFLVRLRASVEAQTARLRANLTPARNHRTIELFALFLTAVVFPEMRDAAAWLEFTRMEIVANLRSDLRPDGVHVEQSTDYHQIVLRNVLAVRRLAGMNGIGMGSEFDALIRRALEFALHVHRPDGFIPALSDGDSASFLSLLEQGYELYGDARYLYVASAGRRGEAPAERARAFPHAGYYILRSGWGERERYEDERYLVFDCGPLGEGNHGHLDLLSFELYAYGQALIVDPGRYTYDESGVNWRVLFRGTGYHNTVQVDGRNQTRYEFHKRKFKIRGPEPEFEIEEFGEGVVRGSARSHEYDVLHRREIRMVNGEYFIVTDWLESGIEHQYDLRFHLAPGSPKVVIAHHADAAVTRYSEQGWVSAVYGVKQPAEVIGFRRRAVSAQFKTLLFPYKSTPPEELPWF